MKKLIILAIVLVIIILSIMYMQKGKVETDKSIVVDSDIVLYYGDGCPHCDIVDEYVEENNIHQKIKFNYKEVYNDNANLRELNEHAVSCGMERAGVPLLWDGEKCHVGDVKVIEYFESKI